MATSDSFINRVTAISAIAASVVYTVTDIWELYLGGYSQLLLVSNYVAFVVLAFSMFGLFAAQRPYIKGIGFLGTVLFAWSFIYFSHTSLYAIENQIRDYETLWQQLGLVYTLHGVMMVIGGLMFGVATYQLAIFPKWASGCFLVGIFCNLLFALIAVHELWHILATVFRNVGLVGMGFYLLKLRG